MFKKKIHRFHVYAMSAPCAPRLRVLQDRKRKIRAYNRKISTWSFFRLERLVFEISTECLIR